MNFYFTPFYYFLIEAPLFLCGIIKRSDDRGWCYSSLEKDSLRLPHSYERDNLCVLRIYKRIFSKLFSKDNPVVKYNSSTGTTAIFDVTKSSADSRYTYVKYFSTDELKMFVSKEELLSNTDLLPKLFILAIMSAAFIPLLTASLFSKKKYKYPLLIQEAIEVCCLISCLKDHDISKIHYFCIYERDANLNAYLLMKNGIYVNKIPSEVPLFFWNKIIVANELSVCFGYQKEEIEAFKQCMFIDKVSVWAPEKILSAPERFFKKGRNLSNNSADIGYYSSGMWLRQVLNSKFLSDSTVSDEHWLLTSLAEYCNLNKRKLRIYLHPIEKQRERRELVIQHYNQYLRPGQIEFYDMEKASSEDLDHVNLGISLYSTLMFERIYFGFKTVLVPLEMNGFPLAGSGMRNICVTSKDQLTKLLDFNLDLSIEEYFHKNGLQGYTTFLN